MSKALQELFAALEGIVAGFAHAARTGVLHLSGGAVAWRGCAPRSLALALGGGHVRTSARFNG
jgi:hypothetical protein